LFIFLNAFKTSSEYDASKFAIPKHPHTFLDNVKDLTQLGIIKALKNSIIVVSAGVAICAVFTSMAGFAFSKLKFPGKAIIYWFVIGLLAIPAQVFIVPLYVMYSKLNFVDKLLPLSLFYFAWSFSLGTFFMKSFYDGIPNELKKKKKMDGANEFQIYLRIMIPLGKPGILTVSVINFFWFWNELFMALILNRTKDSKLVTPFIALFQEEMRIGAGGTKWPLIFTGSIISLIIPFIIYFTFQNKITKGLVAGAIKG
jgi:ABC-type glycerol-3-phosphate transport system permease component